MAVQERERYLVVFLAIQPFENLAFTDSSKFYPGWIHSADKQRLAVSVLNTCTYYEQRVSVVSVVCILGANHKNAWWEKTPKIYTVVWDSF